MSINRNGKARQHNFFVRAPGAHPSLQASGILRSRTPMSRCSSSLAPCSTEPRVRYGAAAATAEDAALSAAADI